MCICMNCLDVITAILTGKCTGVQEVERDFRNLNVIQLMKKPH